METEAIKLIGQYGPMGVILLVVLFGVYKLLIWILKANAERDKDHTDALRTLIGSLQKLCDTVGQNRDSLGRIERKVNGCPNRIKGEDG